MVAQALPHSHDKRHRTRTDAPNRGQSLVEFALVVPILLFLVIAIADFGRIFATGIILESAARNAAEVAANEYLAEPPGINATPPVYLSAPAPAGDPAYYRPLHESAGKVVCAETQELPNSRFDQATGTCPGMPLVLVCVHDSQDTDCANEVFGTPIPAECDQFSPPPSNVHGGSGTPRWVEVRVCYHFTPVLNVPLIAFDEIWLQRTRTFVIPCYFALGTPDECG